jgi:hypothetical protein
MAHDQRLLKNEDQIEELRKQVPDVGQRSGKRPAEGGEAAASGSGGCATVTNRN